VELARLAAAAAAGERAAAAARLREDAARLGAPGLQRGGPLGAPPAPARPLAARDPAQERCMVKASGCCRACSSCCCPACLARVAVQGPAWEEWLAAGQACEVGPRQATDLLAVEDTHAAAVEGWQGIQCLRAAQQRFTRALRFSNIVRPGQTLTPARHAPAGMAEVWEDGTAFEELRRRRAALADARDAIEAARKAMRRRLPPPGAPAGGAAGGAAGGGAEAHLSPEEYVARDEAFKARARVCAMPCDKPATPCARLPPMLVHTAGTTYFVS
jgi:hypothetical protein